MEHRSLPNFTAQVTSARPTLPHHLPHSSVSGATREKLLHNHHGGLCCRGKGFDKKTKQKEKKKQKRSRVSDGGHNWDSFLLQGRGVMAGWGGGEVREK